MRRGVYEVGVAVQGQRENIRGRAEDVRYQSGGEADDRSVEADDEDLGVGVEGLGDVQVEGDKGPQPILPEVGLAGGGLFGYGDVGATVMFGRGSVRPSCWQVAFNGGR